MTRHQEGRLGLFTAVATFALAALLVASSCGKDERKDDKKDGATGGTSSGDTDDGPAESVTLTWDAPDAAADVASYKIYVAADKQSKGKLVTSVPTDDADFDADSPSADLEIANEAVLEDMLGEKACFSVTALNAAGGESGPSEKVCVEL
jgi:hypothetical protein